MGLKAFIQKREFKRVKKWSVFQKGGNEKEKWKEKGETEKKKKTHRKKKQIRIHIPCSNVPS